MKLLGFIIAIVVALVGYFVSNKRTIRKLVITPFNGLLIYLTIMGGTTFLPQSTHSTFKRNSNSSAVFNDTASVNQKMNKRNPTAKPATHFLMSWNAQKPDPGLVEKTTQLSKQNKTLQEQTNKLQQENQVYKTKLDSTKQVIKKLDIPPQVQKNLLNNLQFNNQLKLHPVNN